MTSKTLTGSYAAGYAIIPPVTFLTIAAGGYVAGNGVTTPLAGAGSYTVVNHGKVKASGVGVYLYSGGSVTNGSGADTLASIVGSVGVVIGEKPGKVVNFATISALKAGGQGVILAGGGAVTNGSVADNTALIQGAEAVGLYGVGSVTNFGTLLGAAGAPNSGVVYIGGGGRLTNGSAADTLAVIKASGGSGSVDGVVAQHFAATAVNFGSIIGQGAVGGGVLLGEGGRVTNGSTTDHNAMIEGASAIAVYSAAGTIANFGTLLGTTSAPHGGIVYLGAGGLVTNGSASDMAASIMGSGAKGAAAGVAAKNVAATVLNFGSISGTDGAYAAYAIYLEAGGKVVNGAPNDTGAYIGVSRDLAGHGDYGGYNGVVVSGGVGTVLNLATISGYFHVHPASNYPVGGTGVYLKDGGAVSNGAPSDAHAVIFFGRAGIHIKGAAGSVTNLGTVEQVGTSIGVGVVLQAGGRVTNGSLSDSTALISGGGDGDGVDMYGPGTVTNYGTIVGGHAAVSFDTPGGTLRVGAGSRFLGSVDGYYGTLVLLNGVGTLSNLSAASVTVSGSMAATDFLGFDTVQVGDAATFTDTDVATTLTAKQTLVAAGALTLQGAITNAGRIDVNGGTLTVAASGLTIKGTGAVVLDNSAANLITGAMANAALTIGQTLEGAGRVGGGAMNLVVSGTGLVRSQGAADLAIDTGANTIINQGRIEADGSGGVAIDSAIANTGKLIAQIGTLTVNGVVSGTGYGQIGGGTLRFTAGSSFNQNVAFVGTGGTLELAHGRTYAGRIRGFSTASNTFIDLDDIAFGATTTASYSGTSASGVLTVTDGTHAAHIHYTGNYLNSNWAVSDDGHGGTRIIDPARPPPAGPFAQAMAGIGARGRAGAAYGPDVWRAAPPMLARPGTRSA